MGGPWGQVPKAVGADRKRIVINFGKKKVVPPTGPPKGLPVGLTSQKPARPPPSGPPAALNGFLSTPVPFYLQPPPFQMAHPLQYPYPTHWDPPAELQRVPPLHKEEPTPLPTQPMSSSKEWKPPTKGTLGYLLNVTFAGGPPPSEYPSEMKDYMKRAFKLGRTPEEKTFIYNWVQSVLLKAIEKRTIHSRNWGSQCLPKMEVIRKQTASSDQQAGLIKKKIKEESFLSLVSSSEEVGQKRKMESTFGSAAQVNSKLQKQKRQSRFNEDSPGSEGSSNRNASFFIDTEGDRGHPEGVLRGRCCELEKSYFRQVEVRVMLGEKENTHPNRNPTRT